MLRVCLLSLLVLTAALGCRKNAEEHAEGNISSSGSPAAVSISSDWAVANDIAVRIDRVRIQKPVVVHRAMVTGETKEEEVDKPDLMIWVSIENRTKTKKLDYSGWRIAVRDAPKLTDEHGNTYSAVNHGNMLSTLKGEAPYGALNPGDAPVSDVLCFQKPIPAATKLTLTLPSLTKDESQGYAFEIPADAWKGGSKATPTKWATKVSASEHKRVEDTKPKAEEKFVGLDEPSRVGDVSVRVKSALVMKVPLKSIGGSEYTSKEPELVLVIAIENHSKTKKLDYFRWRAGFGNTESITDEHGNKYRLHERDNVAEGEPFKTIQPEATAHVDLLCIEPPVEAATELKVILPSLVDGVKGRHCFKIPASAWKKK